MLVCLIQIEMLCLENIKYYITHKRTNDHSDSILYDIIRLNMCFMLFLVRSQLHFFCLNFSKKYDFLWSCNLMIDNWNVCDYVHYMS